MDYLVHYGILGMKWGVRRYQNKDGTLTAAGKKRYNKERNETKVSDMTDDELNASLIRKRMEKEYENLRKRGKTQIGTTLEKSGNVAIQAVATPLITQAIRKTIECGKEVYDVISSTDPYWYVPQ